MYDPDSTNPGAQIVPEFDRPEPTESVHVPNSEGRALRVADGQSVVITDLEGGQIADTWAFSDTDFDEHLSDGHTRVATERLMPKVGETFVSNRRRPVLTFEEDASSGPHDFLIPACDATRYEGLGVKGWHPNCQENLMKSLHDLGRTPRTVPQPINFFQNTPFGEDGALTWLTSITSGGEYVRLRAHMDVIVVVTACPQRAGAPGSRHGPLQVDVY